jgi:ABC-2 type transport system permease protein
MSDILLIAWREFVQYIRTRGFLLTLFFIPAWLVLAGLVRDLAAETRAIRYFGVVDESGRYSDIIDRAFAIDRQQTEFQAFADWAMQNTDGVELARKAPSVSTLLQLDGTSPATLARFAEAGGVAGLMPIVRPLTPAGSPAYVPPIPLLRRIALPVDVATAARSHDRAALLPILNGERRFATPEGSAPLFALAIIPADFSADQPSLEYWCINQTDQTVLDFLRRALRDQLRLETAGHVGLDPTIIRRLLNPALTVQQFNPANTTGNGAVTKDDILRILLPFAIAILLLVAILSISSMLLMAVIEEKSSRVIELILASTSAQRLMAGKLLGAAGAAVILVGGWALGGGGTISLLYRLPPGGVIEALARAHALGELPGIALCFFCGLAIHTTIFLGVGAMARSFQEAQSYLGPLLFVLFAPVGFIAIVFSEPNGLIATLLSFSPVHAPFFLMIRLPNNPPVLSTTLAFIWMIVCTVGIVRLMVLGFVKNILRSEGSPGIGSFGHWLLRPWYLRPWRSKA